MILGVLATVAVAGVALYVIHMTQVVRMQPVGRTTPLSPLDEAERILASRYARGMITAEEYDRTIAVLHR